MSNRRTVPERRPVPQRTVSRTGRRVRPRGGEVLAPDQPDDPCQFIDSRDLAEWTIRMALTKGPTFRPLAVTAKDTLDWHKTRSPEAQAATLEGKINGLSMKREAEVLAAWKEELAKQGK